MKIKLRFLGLNLVAISFIWTNLNAADWQAVIDPERLRALFSDTLLKTKLKDGVEAEANYNADGTGELRAWGETFSRTWEIRGSDQVCIGREDGTACFTIEEDRENIDNFRAKNLDSGELIVMTVTRTGNQIEVESESPASGGAAKPSADEIAASLANPNTPLATLNFKFQYRQFKGDLPGADDETSTGMIFQPVLPFPLENGDKVIFRPAFPYQFRQPVFDADDGDFSSASGFGDIGYDLAYAPSLEGGKLFAYGVVGSIPVGSNDLGSDRWTLGPELLIGKATKTWVGGGLLTHQWDIAGSGDTDISLSTFNLFYVYLPGGGWNVGTAPVLTYNHETSEATVPININAGKTVIWDGRPWKLSVELNYYVDTPEAFAQDWFIGFNIAPVVENGLANWFK